MAAKKEIVYSDLDLAFNIHPSNKDLAVSYNDFAIQRSMRNLVLTNHYERPFQPEIGSNVRKMLFEPLTPLTVNYIEKEIETVIIAFEPRVSNIKVESDVDYDNGAIFITIYYTIIKSQTQGQTTLTLEPRFGYLNGSKF